MICTTQGDEKIKDERLQEIYIKKKTIQRGEMINFGRMRERR